MCRQAQSEQKPGAVKARPVLAVNKEQNEELMEGLMNRIVARPGFGSDAKQTQRIERLLQVKAFQKMVAQVDLLQDVSSSSSFLNQSQFMQKSLASYNKLLPSLPQMAEDEHPSSMPRFGQSLLSDTPLVPDALDREVEALTGQKEKPDELKVSGIMAPAEGISFFDNSSFIFDPKSLAGVEDEYDDDEDPGFDAFVVSEENFAESCEELARQYDYPRRAIKPDTAEDRLMREQKRAQLAKDNKAYLVKSSSKEDSSQFVAKRKEEAKSFDEEDGRKVSILPAWVKHMPSNDEFYPAEFDRVIYDCYQLRVVFDREKTGFEETKDFPIVVNSIIAGRYQVVEYLGSAAFSKAIQCYDIHKEQMVCMKIIENNKDYFDQSVDEIKLLRFLQANCADLDQKHLLRLIDFFYHKEHLFIVTELLRDNLYEYSKFNREQEQHAYFTVPRLQKLATQILEALECVHALQLIHCDLKPENILIKSYSQSQVKVIDFGSSCFIHDHLSSYVQSRSYRAPEVILGCAYDYKIDLWSLGCILAELLSGYVLFQNESIQGLLARIQGIIGPFPQHMVQDGKLAATFLTKEGLVFQENKDDSQSQKDPKLQILVAKKTSLKQRLQCEDALFLDFVRWLLEVDPFKRPTAKQALKHPWLQHPYPPL